MGTPYVESVQIRGMSPDYIIPVEATARLNVAADAIGITYTGSPTQSVRVHNRFTSWSSDLTSADIIFSDVNGVVFNAGRENRTGHGFAFGKISDFQTIYTWATYHEASYYDQGGPSGSSRQFIVFNFLLTGYKTLINDIPASGKKVYDCDLDTTTVAYDGSGGVSARGNVTVDFSHRTITSSIVARQSGWIAGNLPISATLNLAGNLSSSDGSMSGDVTSPDGFTGQFYGSLFGPQGTEMQIIFTISRSGRGAAGRIICK
ncbi:hypothetical protein M2336_001909 [Sphingobium sp. B1D7B]|uniref:hypothetical protein n=1 Tax=Sphingobium sp. B1D7B TaxID=2940578 RepID=UPI0022243779|nr:hypothetical protein [Sphingobium sp. B1D7B]MCW2405280.1 hypothetical protein [Sphingobium sp. B1D7B]